MNTEELYAGCPVQHALKYFGGKWQIAILNSLKKQPCRFLELKKRIPGISEKVLTQELRFFESNRIIKREVFADVPPRVVYSLTTEGLTLVPVIEKIIQWGYDHLQEARVTPAMQPTPVSVIEELERNAGVILQPG